MAQTRVLRIMIYDTAPPLDQLAPPLDRAAPSLDRPAPALDHAPPPLTCPAPQRSLRTDFLRHERLVFLFGAMAVGVAAGFIAAVAVGRRDFWAPFLTGAPILALALCLTLATYVEARRCGAHRCSIMAVCNAGALILWPVFVALPPAAYVLAPLVALLSATLLASCWNGSTGAIYRAGAQTILVAALASHQGTMLILGGSALAFGD
jgi:hypothetical protein